MQSLVSFLLHVHCASNKSSGKSAQMRSLIRALVLTIHGVCNECAVAISTFSRRWCFYWLCEASARAIKIGRPEIKVGLPCSYLPTQNRPYPKKSLPFWESLFSFSRILLTNSSLKSVKAVFLIEERLLRLLLFKCGSRGGGQGVRTPMENHKQLEPPPPPPPGKSWTPLEPWKMIVFFEINHLTSVE